LTFHSKNFWQKSKSIQDAAAFNECALELFYYQREHVPVYKNFLRLLKKDEITINHFTQIPFLPVSLFKSNVITDSDIHPEFYFSSSGTSGQITSKHYLADTTIYDESLLTGFNHFYGQPDQYCFLALLPSYLERTGSSLVYMMEHLIKSGNNSMSGFFLNDHYSLHERLKILIDRDEKIFLLGVTYALLDFFEKYPIKLSNAIVMETGGMKGKRKELIKSEVHQLLTQNTGLTTIHSEYGMTELLSQAYSTGAGIFICPPWMKVIVNDLHDPFALIKNGTTGIIKVIDLANIHSCAFVETQDLGRLKDENKFEVLGRIDNSELRGCNLMIE